VSRVQKPAAFSALEGLSKVIVNGSLYEFSTWTVTVVYGLGKREIPMAPKFSHIVILLILTAGWNYSKE